MKEYNLVIIGAGASGLLAGIAALEENIENVLIIEQEEDLGGNLNLFINNDFLCFFFKFQIHINTNLFDDFRGRVIIAHITREQVIASYFPIEFYRNVVNIMNSFY